MGRGRPVAAASLGRDRRKPGAAANLAHFRFLQRRRTAVAATTGPVRWGLVGLGHFAAEAILPAIGPPDRAVAVACAGRDPAQAQDFAREFGIARVYDGYAKLVRDPE